MSIDSVNAKANGFEKLGAVLVRRKKLALASTLLFVILSGVIGGQVFARFNTGGYSNENGDAIKVANFVTDELGMKDPAVVLIANSTGLSVDDPNVAASVSRLEALLKAEPTTSKVISYWSAGNPANLKSKNGESGYIFVYLNTSDFTEIEQAAKTFQKKYDGKFENLDIYLTGSGIFAHAINGKIKNDLVIAESIAIPLTFILLLLVFGSMVSAAMPLVVGGVAILGTFLILYLLTLVTEVSIFALNLTTGLGLGLGIDYALLMINRFREEMRNGKDKEAAVIEMMRTAGRTVFFSGLTVVLTLLSLTLFPIGFLKSMGYAGSAVVAVAVIAALTSLPALLVVLGKNINKGKIRKGGITPKEQGRWTQVARLVMRRPISVTALSLAALAFLIAPISDVTFAQIDSRALPKNDRAYIADSFVVNNFSGEEGTPIQILWKDGANKTDAINSFANRLSVVDGVARVDRPQVMGNAVLLTAIHSTPASSPEAQNLIKEIRQLPHPPGMLVGGFAADFTDAQEGITSSISTVVLWISVVVLLLLFLFTGSILLPIKALLLNGVSLAATVGLLTLIFISGKLTFLVGDFTNTGTLDTNNLVLVMVVAFALSMDYELFLLSRIREEYLSGKSNADAVAIGLQKSARIITAAALVLAVNFAAFITSGVSAIKMIGIGIAFAILLDATVIRGLLVPALMKLMGDWNWWAPKALQRFSIKH
jgi:RND superfamily putative drug exporter